MQVWTRILTITEGSLAGNDVKNIYERKWLTEDARAPQGWLQRCLVADAALRASHLLLCLMLWRETCAHHAILPISDSPAGATILELFSEPSVDFGSFDSRTLSLFLKTSADSCFPRTIPLMSLVAA